MKEAAVYLLPRLGGQAVVLAAYLIGWYGGFSVLSCLGLGLAILMQVALFELVAAVAVRERVKGEG